MYALHNFKTLKKVTEEQLVDGAEVSYMTTWCLFMTRTKLLN